MQLALFVAQLLATDAGASRVFDWDVPRPVAVAQVGSGRLEAMGLPLDMRIARSKWKLNDLGVHYARRFIEAGFYIPPHQKPLPGSNLPRLSALDPVSMWSYLIVFYPEADGTTTLFLGAADLGHRRPMKLESFPAPVFPGASEPSTVELEGARAMTFVTSAKESEVSAFYKATLTGAGWAERTDEQGTFVKNGRQLRVLAKPQGPRLGVVVMEDADRSPGLSGSSAGPDSR